MNEDPEIPSSAAALEQELRASANQPPANPMRDNSPWEYLLRAPVAAIESTVRPVLHGLLLADEAIVRQRALEVLMALPSRKETTARLLDAAGRPDLFGGSLRARLEHALSNVSSGSGREREILRALRALVGDEPPDDTTATLFATYDPDFTEDVVRRFGTRDEFERFCIEAARTFALYQRDRLLALLTLMRPLTADVRERVLAELTSFLAVPEANVVKLTSKAGVPPPRQPAPSEVDCRAALALQ